MKIKMLPSEVSHSWGVTGKGTQIRQMRSFNICIQEFSSAYIFEYVLKYSKSQWCKLFLPSQDEKPLKFLWSGLEDTM